MPYKDPAVRRAKGRAYTRKYRTTNPERAQQSSRDSMQRWRDNNPEGARNWRFKVLYGLSRPEYDRMLKAQEGRCAICGNKPPKGTRLTVDHCHATGAVRSLLCGSCNAGLGNFRDDQRRLLRAVTYLQQHQQRKRSD